MHLSDSCLSNSSFWINRNGGTAKGGTAKMISWTRVRRICVFRALAQGLSIFLENVKF